MFSDGVDAFVDDLLIHAPTKVEHDVNPRKVLVRCQQVSLN